MTENHEAGVADVSSGLEIVEESDCTIVRGWGELDLLVRQSAGGLFDAVAARGLPVVIDTADVTFVDSAGISVLVRLARDAERHGYSITLRNASPMLQDLLTVTGVDRLLPFEDAELPG